MTLLLPKEEIHWERAVEQLVQQHHTDLQRLWRRVPIGPQAVGIPLTGISFPGDPDEFGSQATFGPYSGSPYSETVGGKQYARPDSDISVGSSWTASTGSDFWALLDETVADDGDYVSINTTPPSVLLCGLTDVSDPGVNTGHVVRIRGKTTASTPMTATLLLKQGSTTIKSITVPLTNSWGTSLTNLSEAEASAITDYTDLRMSIEASFTAGQSLQFSWFELEVPSP